MIDAVDIKGPSVQERLLNAAEQVVARDGVANLSLDAVAREAGVSKGGLLYHFPSKSALITQIVARMASRCEAEQAKAVADEEPSPGLFTRAYLKARIERPDPQRVPIHCALLAAAGTDPQYLDPLRERFNDWQSKLEADGIDPAKATIVRLAIDAMCLWSVFGLPVPQGELRQQIMDTLFEMTRQSNAPKAKD